MVQLKSGKLFPFIQVQDICEMSLFHPSVYPQFKDPKQIIQKKEEKRRAEIKEPEPAPRRSSNSKQKMTH